MQNKQEFYQPSEEISEHSNEDRSNNDPRERQQSSSPGQAYRAYNEGYTGSHEHAFWPLEGEKLQPEPRKQRSLSELLILVVLVCAIFIAGSFSGLILSWLTWFVVTVLVIAGVAALIANWRVVTIPMPPRSFQITEHTRLALNNGSGKVTIQRGEEGIVSVSATKRISGLGIKPERMQIDYQQYGDLLDISSRVPWHLFQLGMHNVDFAITVPMMCDIQLQNGSGQIVLQGTRGQIRAYSGSGSVFAHDLQGEIAMKTGSGRIEAGNLQGQIDLRTGSGRIEADNLQGQIDLRTGSSRILLGGVRGQIKAQTGSGRIEITHSALNGESLLKTGSSSISVEGSLDPLGAYTFQTGSGRINLILPNDTAFSLHAKTGSGGVQNAFGGNEVGTGPRPLLKLKTGSGGIHIQKNDMI